MSASVSNLSTASIDRAQPTVHIGSGAGFAGDRADAAIPVVASLANRDGPRYLIYEVMGERTLAIAQRLKLADPTAGYSPWLQRYLPNVLADCLRHKIRIVANFGNANPQAAACEVHRIAASLGLPAPRVAIVTGDDLTECMTPAELAALPPIEGTDTAGRDILAANAYVGAQPVADALALAADIVLVGRTTDAALVLGPLIHEFGWTAEQLDLLAAGTVAGHLLECGAQVTGGYFADPGFKDVDDLHDVGFPIASLSASGEIVLGKAENTGGVVSRATVTEQLLYEVHDPEHYLTPDVTVDLSAVEIMELAQNRVKVTGVIGKARPPTYKVTLSVDAGWLGEGEISYAGSNALARAQLAADVLRQRVELLRSSAAAGSNAPCRIEVLGTGTLLDDDGSSRSGKLFDAPPAASGEYRVRAALRAPDKALAQAVSDEVLALYCCGPAGGGGVRQHVTRQVSTASVLVPRDIVEGNVRAQLVDRDAVTNATPTATDKVAATAGVSVVHSEAPSGEPR